MTEQELINEIRRHGLAILAALEVYFREMKAAENKEKEKEAIRRN